MHGQSNKVTTYFYIAVQRFMGVCSYTHIKIKLVGIYLLIKHIMVVSNIYSKVVELAFHFPLVKIMLVLYNVCYDIMPYMGGGSIFRHGPCVSTMSWGMEVYIVLYIVPQCKRIGAFRTRLHLRYIVLWLGQGGKGSTSPSKRRHFKVDSIKIVLIVLS